VSDFASKARRASTRLGTRWGGPSWKSRLDNHNLKFARIEPKQFSVVSLYILMNINVEIG